MEIKKTAKGNILIYQGKPIIVFKGRTYALTKSSIKFFDVTPELREDIIRIAIETINLNSRDTQRTYALIDDITYKHSFEYTNGPLKLCSGKRFDEDFMKF